MKKYLVTAATLLFAGIIAGCGGGSSTPTSTSPTSVSGTVADGYLYKATVFLDKNANYQLDTGEPSTITDQNGAYTLNMDPADVGQYPIVALATAGVTIDMDDPTQPIPNSYLLCIPKTAISGTVSNCISPLSSQLREMLETGLYTMEQAKDQLRTQLGLSVGTDVLANYMTNQNNANYQAMHTAARNMAALMGSQAAQVMTSDGTRTNRYRYMMGTIFSNMSSLRGSNAQSAISGLTGTMTSALSGITPGQPFCNMSTVYRGGGARGTSGGGKGGMM